jgi:hypothetical protein
MFFTNQDTVSAYTLAAAVEGILGGLLKQKGTTHPFRESDLIREGMEAEFNRILNQPQNFFKHADKDRVDALEFPAVALEYLLFECTVLYELLTGRVLRESWVFFIWFGIHHPNLVKDGPLKAALAVLKSQVPTITTDKSLFLDLLNRAGDLWPDTD